MWLKKITENTFWGTFILIVFTGMMSILITYSAPVVKLEHKITDQLFQIRGPLAVEDSTIVLVSISQQANEAIPEKYPWPTKYYAKLIENLNKAGARAIGLDVVFDKTDFNPGNDSLFAAALKKYGNVVLAGDVRTDRQPRGQGGISITTSLVEPNPILSKANPNPMGLVKVVKDNDDEVRRQLIQLHFRGATYYPLALELLRIYKGWDTLPYQKKGRYFSFGPYRVPQYNNLTMAINYKGPPATFPQYSFDSVIDDSTVLLANEDADFQTNAFSDPDWGLLKGGVFKNKIVLVGATMPELHDSHSTPFASTGSMAGYEIQANALQTIMSGQYIYYLSPLYNLLLLLLFATLIVVVTRKARALWGLIFYFVLGAGAITATVYVFLHYSYIIRLTGPLITLTIGYLATNSVEYFTEQREKRRIRNMFSSYVSPALVQTMIASGQEPQLGGDEFYMTAFFSDIVSFSSFSEQLQPQQLVSLINEYLSALTDILIEGGGTLDKYIGDAIVAFFGAPVLQKNHAYKACITSQKMQKKLAELREKWKAEGDQWPDIVKYMRTRIGINTGTMVTGNMGSARRFNYTMMGDDVNLAARCESGAKSYGVFTMVTRAAKEKAEEKAEETGDRCVFRYLDCIVVKGRTEPVDVFEIIGLKEDLTQRDYECKTFFKAGITHYKAQRWEQAIDCFRQSSMLEVNQPSDDNPIIKTNPSLLYLERCQKMQTEPPPPDWNGVFVMKTK